MLLYATEVAALGGICPEFPQLIGSHAAAMPQDVMAAHHTLLYQGVDNPGVVFDWHTDTAQENDSSERGSGKALLTAIHLIWTSSDYNASGMEVLGKDAVVYSEVGDTMVFSAHCVHKSKAPEEGQCIKLVTTYTHKTTLPVSLRHKLAAKLFQAAQYGADIQPSADLACMLYNVLRNVSTMHECTARAYSFMLLMAAGAMSVAPSLLVSSLTHPEVASMTLAEVDSVITSTTKSLGSNSALPSGCSRPNISTHRRLYLGQSPFPPANQGLFTCDKKYTGQLAQNISDSLQTSEAAYNDLPAGHSTHRTVHAVDHCMTQFSVVSTDFSTMIADESLKPGVLAAILGVSISFCTLGHSQTWVQLFLSI